MDRFLPLKSAHLDYKHHLITKNNDGVDKRNAYTLAVKQVISSIFYPMYKGNSDPKILKYLPDSNHRYSNPTLNPHHCLYLQPPFTSTNIRQQPIVDVVLDAPGFIDDFFANVVDWGHDNVIAVALDSDVHLKAMPSGLAHNNNECVSGILKFVTWAKKGHHLAAGAANGDLVIMDPSGRNEVNFKVPTGIQCADWSSCQDTLAVGLRVPLVIVIDYRTRSTASNLATAEKVSGIKWSKNGNFVASGTEAGTVEIFDMRNLSRLHTLSSHRAAVKAIAWNPCSSSTIVSGGGTKDGMIKMWDINSGRCIMETNTDSQICHILWTPVPNELISAHGFKSNNINIWDPNHLRLLASGTDHNGRVISIAHSPDGKKMISAGADERIRIWDLHCQRPGDLKHTTNPNSIFDSNVIR